MDFSNTSTIIFKKAFNDLIDSAKVAIGSSIDDWKNDTAIQKMYEHISNFGFVKTLWQIDKPVYLDTFFCFPYIRTDNDRFRFSDLNSLLQLTKENLIIRGIAGQGKSILLRHICISELERCTRIPIFVELRRVSDRLSFKECIFNEFNVIGLKIDGRIFEKFAKSGKLLLLLDGYDEIDSKYNNLVSYEIEQLAKQYRGIKILVTTRPNTSGGIEMSNNFSTVNLDNLENDEYINYINKLIPKDKTEYKELLLKKIRYSNQLRELLKTPLMITILIITYKSHQYIPSKISDFYEELFLILYQRHDGTKPGFVRQKNCKLDQYQSKKIMNAMCCISKHHRGIVFKEKDLYSFSEKALKFYNLETEINPESYYTDIIHLTGLIANEGDEFRFLHKSLQEFFCAKFINELPDQKLSSYVQKYIIPDVTAYQTEFEFLSELNRSRLLSKIFLPTIEIFSTQLLKENFFAEVEKQYNSGKGVPLLLKKNSTLDDFLVLINERGPEIEGILRIIISIGAAEKSLYEDWIGLEVYINVLNSILVTIKSIQHKYYKEGDYTDVDSRRRMYISLLEFDEKWRLICFEMIKLLNLELALIDDPATIDDLSFDQ